VNLVNLFRALPSHARARAREGVKEVHEVHQVYEGQKPGQSGGR
jgi:hypothetical protein